MSNRTDPRTVSRVMRSKCRQQGDHWMWTGRLKEGSPIFNRRRVRQFLWREYVGPLPYRAYLLNVCGHKLCVNPAHQR
jgi:hypothetical protein